MRKIIIYLIFTFLCIQTGFSQYYRQDQGFLLGINAGYLYPTGDMGKILKNGIGGNLSAKYLINKVIGIGFESGYYRFKSKLNLDNDHTAQEYKCNLIPALLEATFYIPTWNRTTLPYLGLQFGGYLTHIRVAQTPLSPSSIPSVSKNFSFSLREEDYTEAYYFNWLPIIGGWILNYGPITFLKLKTNIVGTNTLMATPDSTKC